jgi:periplasmic divalent cation tolerance protein
VDKIIQVVTTGDNRETMEAIGRRLVEQRLASCAQVSGPIRSTYWWKGKVEDATEWVCTLKSTPALYRRIEAAIRELHPYEVPEIVSIAVEKALPAYASWVQEETGGDKLRRKKA